MKLKKYTLGLLSVALPFIILSGIIFKMEYDIQYGQHLRLPIAGFDPRDLLRGHYINFRYQWSFDEEKTKEFLAINKNHMMKDVTLCIPKDKKVYPVLLSDTDEMCDFRILGKLKASQQNRSYDFILGIEKFYVPEKYAKQLEKKILSKRGEIEIAINSQGRAVIVDLFINGVSWKRFANTTTNNSNNSSVQSEVSIDGHRFDYGF